MMTMVAEKRAGGWLVVASQNDDSLPWCGAGIRRNHLANADA